MPEKPNSDNEAVASMMATASRVGTQELNDAKLAAALFTVRNGRRYRATVTLRVLEALASNATVANVFASYGFSHVRVTGTGRTRQAEGTWSGPDTSASIDPRLSDVVELPQLVAIESAIAVAAPPLSASLIRLCRVAWQRAFSSPKGRRSTTKDC